MSLSASEDFSSLSPVYNNFTFTCNVNGSIDKELVIQIDGEEVKVEDIGTRTGAISCSI
jgi:hypothetical protein